MQAAESDAIDTADRTAELLIIKAGVLHSRRSGVQIAVYSVVITAWSTATTTSIVTGHATASMMVTTSSATTPPTAPVRSTSEDRHPVRAPAISAALLHLVWGTRTVVCKAPKAGAHLAQHYSQSFSE